ncbi:hypothetical protein [Streptomyces solaniscabiei]|uniref:hypothetical protein n=1 Tax=Streptomyces solaniscabiei TaxID=2683255 RepID=UPI001CE299EB|nr:hypothetical protein [Streptomyces solaniscabiei]
MLVMISSGRCGTFPPEHDGTWADCSRIDAELERRTLPDPNLIELAMFGWWWTRMRDL